LANKDHKPIDFIKEPKDWIEAFTGLVVAVSAFLALFENYLYSLVFVTLGILIWVSVHLAFSSTMSPIQDGRKIPRYPRWRRPALVGVVIFPVLLLGSIGYALNQSMTAESTPPATPALPSAPLVLLMDSKEPQMIYNPEGGGTNTSDIRDILVYLPIQPPIEELVHTAWDEAEIVYQMEPDLIIIHNSSFYSSTTTEDPQKKLSSFLLAMENSKARFLIYSRADAFKEEAMMKQFFENNFPFLVGRVDVLWVPEGDTQHCSYWECADTRERLRRKVKSLLELP
jgi:hypothetical protein